MAFSLCNKDVIDVGSRIIFYGSPDNMLPLTVKCNSSFQNQLGMFRHEDIIGKSFGAKWTSNLGKFAHVLKPTADLWTDVLSHRTQIIYVPDASFIISTLNIKPGSVIMESGTGSGSLSHHIVNALAPTGHLYTFDYHSQRAEIARKEFEDHGMSPFVTVECRDVCENGFGMESIADAVFLDLPSPWKVIESAKRVLKKGQMSKICCFSPCVEQVQQTCRALGQQDFRDIYMVEVLSKEVFAKPFELYSPFNLIDTNKSKRQKFGKALNDSENSSSADSTVILTSRAPQEVKGHTSFLTFASLASFPDE